MKSASLGGSQQIHRQQSKEKDLLCGTLKILKECFVLSKSLVHTFLMLKFSISSVLAIHFPHEDDALHSKIVITKDLTSN